jgi:hypothetical protein
VELKFNTTSARVKEQRNDARTSVNDMTCMNIKAKAEILASASTSQVRLQFTDQYSGCFLLPPQNESMTTVHIKIALATLATTATELDLEADCGVCFNRFTSENELALPCGHAVCSTCVPGLSRTEQGLIC